MTTVEVIFRVDSTLSIGTGHLIRCLNLARGFRQRGINSLFVCRAHHDSIHHEIVNDEFPILELPVLSNAVVPTISDSAYLPWLGCSESSDAIDFIHLVSHQSLIHFSYLVVDHYAIGSVWESLVSSKFSHIKVIALDDLHNRSHDVDFLLDPLCDNVVSHPYQNLLSHNCKPLFGPFFALLSNDYADLRSTVFPRVSLRKILIFFGWYF